MAIEFGYASARAQARLGDRLTRETWQAIESADSLARYLHACRQTRLAPRVRHFTVKSPVHAIEQSLRAEWRAAVAEAARWSPPAWRGAIRWTAWLPALQALEHKANDGEPWPWLQEDPDVMAPTGGPALHRATHGPDHEVPAAFPDGALGWWFEHWRGLWPDTRHGQPDDLVAMLAGYRRDAADPAIDASGLATRRADVEKRIVRLLRSGAPRPSVVLGHLALTAFELWRLRGGLVRRVLGNDIVPGAMP